MFIRNRRTRLQTAWAWAGSSTRLLCRDVAQDACPAAVPAWALQRPREEPSPEGAPASSGQFLRCREAGSAGNPAVQMGAGQQQALILLISRGSFHVCL